MVRHSIAITVIPTITTMFSLPPTSTSLSSPPPILIQHIHIPFPPEHQHTPSNNHHPQWPLLPNLCTLHRMLNILQCRLNHMLIRHRGSFNDGYGRALTTLPSLTTPISMATVRPCSYFGISSALPPFLTGEVMRKDVVALCWVQGMLNIIGAASVEETPGMMKVGGRGICRGEEVREVGEVEGESSDSGSKGALQKYKNSSPNHL
ncbi:hypothetical protein GYMLUDRAFT_245393 [Collybiopsis luxurians FD-317 M1]|uniref:Uncharacterized protein n=1 Tax=Collybiopsis luxurians FD-317 M1 TaxID=944289 RepID=A0A0D0CL95_9AGAR|nr:hypothetical protein GYMLUDRAFT_245393 [Collybiopsis luxurians FD-317 M1]